MTKRIWLIDALLFTVLLNELTLLMSPRCVAPPSGRSPNKTLHIGEKPVNKPLVSSAEMAERHDVQHILKVARELVHKVQSLMDNK